MKASLDHTGNGSMYMTDLPDRTGTFQIDVMSHNLETVNPQLPNSSSLYH